MIEELFRATQLAERGGDDLYVILKCIVVLRRFIDADELVRDNFLSRPLAILAKSLRDLGQGAKPPLFFNRPKKGPGRPKDVSFEAARGATAAVVAALVEWGELRNEAGKVVAGHLQALNVKLPTGEPIRPKQVLQWRDAIGSTMSELAESTYRSAIARYRTVPPETAGDPHKRRQFALASLSAIWSTGF